jgi:hypothetical protein
MAGYAGVTVGQTAIRVTVEDRAELIEMPGLWLGWRVTVL